MTTRRFFATVVLTALVGWTGCRPSPQPRTLFVEAEELRLRHEKEASHQAIVKYREALRAWERKGEKREAARAGQRIGATYRQLGSLRESLQAYQAALSLARQSADRILESEIRSDVGFVQSSAADRAGLLEEARDQCQIALDLATRSAHEGAVAKALNCLGEVAYLRRQLNQSLEFFREAERLGERVDDRRGQAQSVLSQGYVYSDLGRFDQASAHYDRARSLWTLLNDKREQAIVLVADARLQARRGQYDEALSKFDNAVTLLQPMGDAVWEAAAVTGIARIYQDMAETASALRYWERAAELFETAGLYAESVQVLDALGESYLATGDDTKALNRFERALAAADEQRIERWKAKTLRLIGVVHLFRGLPGEARAYLERSLDVQRSLGSTDDPRLEARTLADMGEAYVLSGDHQLATNYLNQALALATRTGDRVVEARGLFGLARASVGLEELDRARQYVERSLKVAEALRTRVESRELRASYFASVYEYNEFYVDLLMRLHTGRSRDGLSLAAFAASERGRARSLLESLTDAKVDVGGGVDAELLKREEALQRAFDDWADRRRRASSGAVPDVEVKVLAAEYRTLEDRHNRLQAEIRSKSPNYAALAQPQPLSLKELQRQVLDRDTLLLEYALGKERSYLWAVSDRDYTSYELPPRADIERAAQHVYDLLTARLTVTGDYRARRQKAEQADKEYWREAARLSEMLLAPAAGKIAGKRILVVTDGALQYLPFAALPIPGRRDAPSPMLVEHEIVSLPSASVLAVLRRETSGRKLAPKAVAVLADPVFEQDDPRLRSVAGAGTGKPATSQPASSSDPRTRVKRVSPALGLLRDGGLRFARLGSTRQEADAIIAAAPAGLTMKALDFQASRSMTMSAELAQYRIVHFATHAAVNNEEPGLSGIVLSMFDERGQPRDGFLRLDDIYGLKLPVELVVLSACSTALGKQIKGEGLVGMVRGFMYAGAKRIVASLWKVDDDATTELMTRLYLEMLKQNRSPAAALRQAQIAMWQQDRSRAPYYWAGFILQGEWQ